MDTDGLTHLIGLTALVEARGMEATGAVTSVGAEGLAVTCDEDVWKMEPPPTVLVSVFAQEALYRMDGPASFSGLEVRLGSDTHLERIQRRRWPRRRLDLAVTVCPVVGERHLEGVPGRTVDVGVGGLCVETLREVPGEGDPMVILSLPDGTSVVSLTSTVAVEDLGDGWRYRLAFQDLNAHDSGRIADVVGLDEI
jgi:hypothetical protein